MIQHREQNDMSKILLIFIYFRELREHANDLKSKTVLLMGVGIMKISLKKKKKEALPPINKGRQNLNKNPPERENQ